MSDLPKTLPDDPAALKAMILALQAVNARMDADITKMSATLRADEALVQALQIQIARLRKQKFGASSERPLREIERLELALEHLEIEAREGFSAFLWRHVGGGPLQNFRQNPGEIPADTRESQALAKALKREGFKFCGPTISYAFMQATGMVNDHLTTCPAHAEVLSMHRQIS